MVAHARASHRSFVVTPLARLDRPVVLERETSCNVLEYIQRSRTSSWRGCFRQGTIFQAMQSHFASCGVLTLTRSSSKILSPPLGVDVPYRWSFHPHPYLQAAPRPRFPPCLSQKSAVLTVFLSPPTCPIVRWGLYETPTSPGRPL